MKRVTNTTVVNCTLVVLAVMAGATSAQAQAIPQAIPNTARPDVIQRENEIPNARPEVGGAPVISMPATPKKAVHGGEAFTLKSIAFEPQGQTVYGAKELTPFYESKIGTKVTLDDLNEIATDVTNYYRNHGYILTRAIVPPQKAQDGAITIRIVEGFVNDVKLQGDIGKGDPLIQAYADKIKAAKPLNASTLERYLLLMEDLPGVEARAVLQPAEGVAGASDVVVTIKRKPIEVSAGIDNRGSRYLGPVQANADLFLNNLLGLDEYTQLRVSNSIFNRSELKFGEIRHVEQVGAEGTTVVVSANRVDTRPGYELKALDIKGESDAIAIGVSHPLIRSRRANWFINSDFTFRNVETESLGLNLYKDKTRVLGAGTAYDFVDGTGAINKAEANVSHGFNWDTGEGADVRSRANGETDFTKVTARTTRIQPIYGPFSLFGSAAGQYSADPLLASEEFTVGGAEYGSAYDPAEITGDSGFAGRGELQYSQSYPGQVVSQYQLYGFYDLGKVWNHDPIPGSEKESDFLSSAGIGARFNLLDSVSGGVEGAVPLTRNVAALNEAGEKPRVFFNLQYRY